HRPPGPLRQRADPACHRSHASRDSGLPWRRRHARVAARHAARRDRHPDRAAAPRDGDGAPVGATRVPATARTRRASVTENAMNTKRVVIGLIAAAALAALGYGLYVAGMHRGSASAVAAAAPASAAAPAADKPVLYWHDPM